MTKSTCKYAKLGWETYKTSIGGKAFNGDILPSWDEMIADPKKAAIVLAWYKVADAILLEVTKELASVTTDYTPAWLNKAFEQAKAGY